MLRAHEKPDVTYAEVGGLDMQKQEIREAVELPLTHFDLYKQIGRTSPLVQLETKIDNRQVSTLLEESSSTDLRELGRPCWLRLWQISKQLAGEKAATEYSIY